MLSFRRWSTLTLHRHCKRATTDNPSHPQMMAIKLLILSCVDARADPQRISIETVPGKIVRNPTHRRATIHTHRPKPIRPLLVGQLRSFPFPHHQIAATYSPDIIEGIDSSQVAHKTKGFD